MRKWHKYRICDISGQKYVSKDATFADHKLSMGGYLCGEEYNTRDSFLEPIFLKGLIV
jgi:hypothetical protein